ncbi:MAG: PilZ domain-containing protein [Syntrophobacteria bacterium]
MAKDKRQYPRVEISWPATIITADGLVSCRTENLSPEGTLIRCSESPGSLDNFRLVFKPAERQLILTTAEKVWSKRFDSNDSPSHAVGVRFTFIPEHDYQLIKGTVSKG